MLKVLATKPIPMLLSFTNSHPPILQHRRQCPVPHAHLQNRPLHKKAPHPPTHPWSGLCYGLKLGGNYALKKTTLQKNRTLLQATNNIELGLDPILRAPSGPKLQPQLARGYRGAILDSPIQSNHSHTVEYRLHGGLLNLTPTLPPTITVTRAYR